MSYELISVGVVWDSQICLLISFFTLRVFSFVTSTEQSAPFLLALLKASYNACIASLWWRSTYHRDSQTFISDHHSCSCLNHFKWHTFLFLEPFICLIELFSEPFSRHFHSATVFLCFRTSDFFLFFLLLVDLHLTFPLCSRIIFLILFSDQVSYDLDLF